MARKLYIETYGCQMNDYESDRTYRLLHDTHGYIWTDRPEEADLVLFNTCSIRDKADQKAISSLGRFRQIKMQRPEMVLAFGGCLAQTQGEEIREKFPYIDLVFGTHQWNRLPKLIEHVRVHRERLLELGFYGWQDFGFMPFHDSSLEYPVSDVVTVQNGCDKFCSFCVVPFTRGRQVSRPLEQVVEEVRGLVSQGVKEVTLLGQNVNAYGNDRSGDTLFVDLLARVGEVEGLQRLRFMTSYPTELTRAMVDEMARNPVICEHIHFPLQSGSDRMLAKMRREHTLKQYREIYAYLIDKIENISITTDVIVGFPSETEEDFQATLNALEEFTFDDSFSFVFSPRPHTKAAKWNTEFVDPDVAQERLDRYQARQSEIKRIKNQALKGSILEVLVEGESKRGEGRLFGKTRSFKTVNFEGPKEWIGTMRNVRICEIMSHTLRGESLVD